MADFDALTRRSLLGGAAAAALASTTGFSFAASPDVMKLILEFRIYGGNAPMFLAQDSIYKKNNLDITPIGSSGSGEAVRQVAAGLYQFARVTWAHSPYRHHSPYNPRWAALAAMWYWAHGGYHHWSV